MLVLLHLFALFLLVLLGFYVFVADPRSRAHQTFAAFIAFLALWTTKDLLFWNFPDLSSHYDWWAAASFVIALLMQCSLVVFAWVFPENSRTPRRKAAVLFAPSLVLIPAALLGFLWRKISFQDSVFSIELAPLAYVFVVYVYFVFFYGSVVLLKKYRQYRGTQMGQQVGAILWGLVITGILKTLANIIFPYFGIYTLLPLSSIFVLPGVLIYAYAILNFRLFSLQTALDQFRLIGITSKIALTIAVVAVCSFLIFQVPIVWFAFGHGMDPEAWRKYLVFSVITALAPNLLLVLLIVRTISRPLQRITVAAVQVTNGEYGTLVDLRKSKDEIGLLADSFNEMSGKMAADIKQFQDLNEQLLRTEKLAAMGTLAAGIAHEVNNPLASISSLIQMIQTEGETTLDTKEKLKLIASQIDRISRVTKDMTDFARAQPPARQSANVNALILTSLRLARFDESFSRLDIEIDLGTDIKHISADVDQLQQVFLNLLLNARDAMPRGGRLTIGSREVGRDCVVTISDNGSGIDATKLNQIFDPFFTTKPAGKGTGLGLAVCYGIVTAHGGSIEAIPGETRGTRFVVKIPIENGK